MSSHLFHIASMPPQKSGPFGTCTDVNQLDMPILNGMSLSLMTLNPNSMREPHWHPNAHTLGYCLEGKALVTIISKGSKHDTFVVDSGTLFFVPMGSLFHVENLGSNTFKTLLCYNHTIPEEINLSTSIGVTSSALLGAAVDINGKAFAEIEPTSRPITFVEKLHHPMPIDAWQTNAYKLSFNNFQPQLSSGGGWIKMSNSYYMPSLAGLSMYKLHLEPNGAREPHWHPNADELNYLISGSAKVTILTPGGDSEVFAMKGGDMCFIPQGYLHVIENSETDAADFAIFYNTTDPTEIGLSGCLKGYSSDVLAPLFKVPATFFDEQVKSRSDLFVLSGGG